ncbi:MAG: transcriptional repressor [Firmicutes bacterium HGW-Firmicutes-1]|jgi:Fur family ferric uptake transcriptional regulator|nr:MAG: transcriptional repressor [Firmicutes bacterium HGW-Firmicutes-1]
MSTIKSESFKQMLKDKGFKITSQRESVLEVLKNNASQHMTAEEIYLKVKEQSPEIGLATVYRTIQLLHDLKLIDKLDLNDGFIRYEIGKWDAHKHHHHHLICEVCGKVIEAEDDLLDLIEETCSDKYQFKVTNHVVKFYGICSECSSSINEVL